MQEYEPVAGRELATDAAGERSGLLPQAPEEMGTDGVTSGNGITDDAKRNGGLGVGASTSPPNRGVRFCVSDRPFLGLIMAALVFLASILP